MTTEITNDTLPAWRIENFANVTTHGRDVTAKMHSLRALYDCARAEQPEHGMSRAEGDSAKRWAGTANFAAAATLAQTGWAAGAKKIASARKALEPHIKPMRAMAQRNRLRGHHAAAGESPDIARYLQGNPECMIDYRRAPKLQNTRVIKLTVAPGATSRVGTANIINRGACIAAAVELLEMAGMAVEVEIVWSSSGTGCSTHVRTLAKRAGEKMDTAQLAYILAHPSFLRRTLFAAAEKFDDTTRNALGFMSNRSYGAAIPCPDDPGAVSIFAAPLTDNNQYKTPQDSARIIQSLIKQHITQD